ncbi:PREDICTED: myotubularin-related protein 12-like [Tinamus guttatus]|uniref:myotubularin-related protein 12-like n=1 Tax=Tinamus guttatus TaxID=94827 RepID=UPI00052F1001|nr:PREDICTED: myotubularin-related protein 12-like [Tinamus guttatus]
MKMFINSTCKNFLACVDSVQIGLTPKAHFLSWEIFVQMCKKGWGLDFAKEIHIKEPIDEEVNPRLLPGELLLCEASTVYKYIQEDGSNCGTYGKLICTNFKISFLDEHSASDDNEPQFKNKIIGENDITLQCVDQIYGVYDEKKKLLTGQLRKYPEKLIIYCKDLRVFHFCLRYTKEEEVKRIVSGIVHHSQTPKLLKRLFLFSYASAAPNNTDGRNQTVMFDTLEDWCDELERTKGNVKYKAVVTNEGYRVSEKLPLYFVVPMCVSEDSILKFQGRGIPIWCWSCRNGAALLKMSAFPKEQDDAASQMQKAFLDGIYRTISNPPYELLKTEDLSSSLPCLQEIQTAYTRFKQLFLIDNSTDFWATDVKWFSLLESTNWLEIIRRFLKKAIEVAECLERQHSNVLLIEESATDLCCVISSLVQVMMDSYSRTKSGFQSLIQKEWVTGGHSFLDRCNHLHKNDKEEAPVFLLLLNCVWQLVQQYPPAFEFTETYLTVLSDSIYVPIFSTFFFNSQHQKDTNMTGESLKTQSGPFKFLTVWDWSVQFEPEAQALLSNPLYAEKPKPDKRQRKTTQFKHQRQLSLPLTQTKSPPKRGFFREETDHLIKNILGKRIGKFIINSSDEPHNSFREFYDSWHSKPVDYHGLLLPSIDGPEIKVWAQRYLRWIPEVQLPRGGTIATAAKILNLMEEVQSLQVKMDEEHSQAISQDVQALPMLRSSARLSSLFPFALLQRQSIKPALPTSTWKDLEDEDDLVKRDDEFVDLSGHTS